MKQVLFIFILSLGSAYVYAQQGYRYGSEYISLEPQKNLFFVQTKDAVSNKKFEQKMTVQQKENVVKSFARLSTNRYVVVSGKQTLETGDYVSNIYTSSHQGQVIVLPRIVLYLQVGKTIMPVLAKYGKVLSVEETDGMKYILKCALNSSYEVLKIVGSITSMDEVKWCEPEMLMDYKPSNPLYPQQYYLKNTGQDGGTPGIDINIEPAWEITNGSSSITVAVIDDGVDRNHEDFGGRVLPGYTIGNEYGLGEPQRENTASEKGHGTACAGIIAASNNQIGIRGVASNVNILPINIFPDYVRKDFWGRYISTGAGSTVEIAKAINWAWKRADVLSCSWGGPGFSNDISIAIDSARNYGRNGLGCPVVFASGNSYPMFKDVAFPGNLDGVITVGAINKTGEIWYYSQRGSSMDLVAPSSELELAGDIVTTDRTGNWGYSSTNYMQNFGGTSAACPQVAGVAALMLSIRPDLTEAQVKHFLQKTARNLGPQGFDETYGYGLLNADRALRAAALYNVSLDGPYNICGKPITYTIKNLYKELSVDWSVSPDIFIISQTNNSITVKRDPNLSYMNPTAYIKASFSYPLNSTIENRRVIVWKPGFNETTNLIDVSSDDVGEPENRYHTARLKEDLLYTGSTQFEWSVGQGLEELFDDGTMVYFRGDITGKYVLLEFLNPDKEPTQILHRFPSAHDYWSSLESPLFSLSCNSTNDNIVVQLNDKNENLGIGRNINNMAKMPIEMYIIQIWNGNMLVKSYKTNFSTYYIPISDLPKGMYFVRIIKGGKTYTEKFIKK